MAKVKIKTNNINEGRKLKLLEILSKKDIYVTKIIEANDGYVIITAGDTDLDNIFNNDTDQELLKENYTPLIPPELKANRSVLLTNVDSHISNNQEDDIKNELLEKNDWISNIIQVHKFPSGKIIKITFSDSQQARKAQEAGLKLFSMKVPPYYTKQDKYYHVNVCLKCYALDDHNTYQCPESKEYKVCSECSEEGHTYRTCKETNKKCINCHEDHGTMSMRCPKKKEIINNKRKESENKTYAEMTGGRIITTTGKSSIPTIDNNTHTKIFTLMLNAHFLNTANPGTYEAELNKGLKANNLPTIKIPTIPDSKKILKALMPEENKMEEENNREEMEEEREKTEEEIEITQDEQTVEGKEVGLKIYTSKSTGWPKSTLTLKNITDGLNKGTYKYTYTYQDIDESEMLKLLTNSCVDINHECFLTLDDGVFRKVRSGLIEERTPPPRVPVEKKRINRERKGSK